MWKTSSAKFAIGAAAFLANAGFLGCSNGSDANGRMSQVGPASPSGTDPNIGAQLNPSMPGGTTTSTTPGVPTTPGSGTPTPGVCASLGGIGQRIWRLSNQQYSNSVRDVAGLPSGPAVSGGGAAEFAFYSGELERVDDALAYSYWIAADASAVAATLVPTFGSCQSGEVEADCAQRFATTFATRAFRRPVSTEETTKLLAVFTVGRVKDFRHGIELMTKAILQSPSFVYRTELGTGGPTSGETTLSPFELASQLSYLLLDSVPDQALEAAAQSGALGTPAGIAAEFDRLSLLPAAQANMTRIVEGWFGTGRAGAVAKDAVLFPEWNAALKADLVESTRRFIDDTLWNGGHALEDLATSKRVFVNQRLGSYYGLDTTGLADQFVGVEFPANQPRSGLLTYPAMLAAVSNVAKKSVVHRGLYIRKEVICAEQIPPPPDGLLKDPALQQALSMLPTERAAADYRATSATCAGCHSQIDPYGLVFEQFDPVGRFQDMVGGQLVDSSSTLALSPSLTGKIDGPITFGQGIAKDGVFATCAARKLASYALGRTVAGGTCELAVAQDAYAKSDHSLKSLLREIALSKFMQARGGVL